MNPGLTSQAASTECVSATLADLVLAQTAEAIIYANREGVIERWNAAAAAMFGFSASEAIGSSLDLIIPERLRAAHWRGFDAAMKTGTLRLSGHATLTRGLHKLGRKLYIEMSFSLVRDQAGKVLGSVAVARDATEQIEREKAAARAATPPPASPTPPTRFAPAANRRVRSTR